METWKSKLPRTYSLICNECVYLWDVFLFGFLEHVCPAEKLCSQACLVGQPISDRKTEFRCGGYTSSWRSGGGNGGVGGGSVGGVGGRESERGEVVRGNEPVQTQETTKRLLFRKRGHPSQMPT